MHRELTDKQRATLNLIERAWRETGVAPSVEELSRALGVKKSTTHERLIALKRKGYLEHVEGQARTWRPTNTLVSQQRDELRAPIVGRVSAGAPIFAQENIEGWVNLTRPAHGQLVFALRVCGESMRDAGILDGDLVLIRQQPTAEDGDIVLALIDDQDATIKRLRRYSDAITLQPENPSFEPITLPADRVQVQGKVIGLQRDYE